MYRSWLTSTLVCLAACGAPGPAPQETASPELRRAADIKRVEPSTVTLPPGATQAFSAVPASVRPTWTVAEPGGGGITPEGVYTAPATAGTYTVVATSPAGATASAVVTVSGGGAQTVQITAPSPVAVDACATATLGATVTGSADTAVLWRLQDPACGTLTQAGAFTAARMTGPCVAVASAHADPTRTAPVTLQVTERVLGVSVSPTPATVPASGAQQLTTTVTTTCGSFPPGG